MKRKLITTAVFLIVAVVVFLLVHRHLSWEELVANERRLRELHVARPWVSFTLGFLIYVLASLVPGTGGKSIVFGWFYGFWQGVLLVNGALTIAAIAGFLFSRYVFRHAVQSRFGYLINRLDRAMEKDGAFYLLLLRVVHFPYTLTNYSMGATSIRTRDFWWASQLGMLPGNLVVVFAGSQAPSLSKLAEHGAASVFTPQLLMALVLLSGFPFLAHYLVKFFRRKGSTSGD